MSLQNNKTHWLIRVNDGINFKNSKYPFWGVKRGKNNCIKAIVEKLVTGDILWFMTSKNYGGKIIAMAEYSCFYNRNDEPLIHINTFTNYEQGWVGEENWDIQIHYKKLYITEKQDIEAVIQCGGIILKYETFKDRIPSNLYEHYKNFKFYAEPKIL